MDVGAMTEVSFFINSITHIHPHHCHRHNPSCRRTSRLQEHTLSCTTTGSHHSSEELQDNPEGRSRLQIHPGFNF